MRSIDWFEHTVTSLRFRIRGLDESAPYVIERLAALLLDRLPRRVSNRMLGLLPPEVARQHRLLRRSASSDANRSIGYISFVEAAQAAIGVCEAGVALDVMGDDDADILYRQVADAFLWAVAQELPPDLKCQLEEEISAELRARMDLYSAIDECGKVA
jgi:hypothetical protein